MFLEDRIKKMVMDGRDKRVEGRHPFFSSAVCLSNAYHWKASVNSGNITKFWEIFEVEDARSIMSIELQG